MPKLCLALVTPAFQAYPGEPFVPYWADLVAELTRHDGVEVTVFPLRFPSGTAPFALHGARIIPFPLGHVRLRASPKLWSAAVRAIVATHRSDRAAGGAGFNLIHALRGNEAGFVGALAARAIGVPLAVHLFGGELAALPEIGYGSQLYPWERSHVAVALRSARLVTVSSRAMAARASAHLGPRGSRRVRWAPLGVDTTVFRPPPFAGSTSAQAVPDATDPRVLPRLVHVAELNPVKDQATLLQALALLAQVQPAVRLDLVGGGPQLAQLRRLARDLGVARRIQWWGQVPPSAVPLALARAGAFVLSSLHEGQGMVLAEAAAAGLPIASTQVGMAPDLPAEGVRLARPGDPVALARAMAWALGVAADPEARDHVQGVLRQAALRDYDVRVCAARWLGLYAQLTALPRSRGDAIA